MLSFLYSLLQPLLNERGQYYGLGAGGYTPGMAQQRPDEQTQEYTPFVTSEPGKEYGDLMARYKDLFAGGAGSMASYLQRGREKGAELIRNRGASRGHGRDSGTIEAAQSLFSAEFEPRAAMQQGEYMKQLMGDYASAVSSGRTQRTALPTKRFGGGGGGYGGAASRLEPSGPIGGGGGYQSGQWVGSSFVPGLSGYGTSAATLRGKPYGGGNTGGAGGGQGNYFSAYGGPPKGAVPSPYGTPEYGTKEYDEYYEGF